MKDINNLRETLFAAMEKLMAGDIDVTQAKAVADLGQVMVNSAKVEVDMIDKLGGVGTGFIAAEKPKQLERPPAEYSNSGHLAVAKKYNAD